MSSAWPSWRLLVLRWSPVVLPLLVLALMLVLNPTLRRLPTWQRVGQSWAGVALLALGLTPIIITGGIDLSVGSMVGLSAVVAGSCWRELHWPLALALTGGVLAGLGAGLVNGLVILLGINPLVVTLATLAVFRGLAYGVSGEQPVRDFPDALRHWWTGSFAYLPHPVWVLLIAFVVLYVFLHHTWMGRMLYAIGDNPRAARYAAVPVRSLTFSLYAVSGFLAGLVGLNSICEFSSARADEGENLELQAIACVVLGGVRITGGSGHLAGTLLGTLTLAGLLEGMVRVDTRWRPLLTGVFLIVIAVANESLARLRLSWEAARKVAG
jgi:rhamnose transport system permease protein